MKNKKMLIIALAVILVAVAALAGTLIWRFGGEEPNPTDPDTTDSGIINPETTQTPTGPSGAVDPDFDPDKNNTVPVDTASPDIDLPTGPNELATEPTDPIVFPVDPTDPADPANPTDPAEPLETDPDADYDPGETQPQNPADPSGPPAVVDEIDYITMYAQVETICRSGPGDNYDNMGTIRKGAAIAVVPDSDSNGWTVMMNGGNHYYVKTAHIGPTRPGEETEPTVDPDDPWSRYVQDADPETGISWDGESPIIYTYEDGTTGTERRHNATYEQFPGCYATWLDPEQLHGDEDRTCKDCGKPGGDGTNGTCAHYIKDVICPNCGEEIKAHTCHYCDGD